MATADETRVVAIELKNNIAALKAAVDALSTAVDAVNTVTAAWTTNSDDGSLPTSADVAAQVTAYNAISVSLTKPANSISDAVSSVLADAV